MFRAAEYDKTCFKSSLSPWIARPIDFDYWTRQKVVYTDGQLGHVDT